MPRIRQEQLERTKSFFTDLDRRLLDLLDESSAEPGGAESTPADVDREVARTG